MNFKFSNLLGAPYRGGNVLLAGDKQLLTPVGNRVSLVDLSSSDTVTLPFEQAHSITRIALSPSGVLLLTVDEQGRCQLANLPRRIVLHHLSFKGPVAAIKFSPDGQLIAAAVGKKVEIWKTPGLGKEFAPFQHVHSFTGAHDQITCIDWSPDSRSVLAGCKDLTVRVFGLDKDAVHGYRPFTLTGHRDVLVGVFWTKDAGGKATGAYSVSRDGALFEWKLEHEQEGPGPSRQKLEVEDDESEPDRGAENGNSAEDGPSTSGQDGGRWHTRRRPRGRGSWRLEGKHFFHQPAKLTCADFHSGLNLLVAGFSNGIFGLYQMPDFAALHLLSVSKEKLTTVAFNESGEWLAFGCARLGQLLVWEWRSETYVLKQQGHYYDVNTLGYSGDGQLIATGADDAKLKIWNAASGFCFVTFTEHKMPITAVTFAPSGHAVLSASLDGTVRAFDLVRYRNFRTFTSPSPAQFVSLAVDNSGEVVVAGSLDTFQLFVWSMKTGRLLDVLSGHEGPIYGLSFSPTHELLASASWDGTVRLWDVFTGKGGTEVLQHNRDVLALAYRPDGKQLASCTLDAQISFWDPFEGNLTGTIEGRRDIAGGRLVTDRQTAASSAAGKCFHTLAYSADGAYLVAGGNSKFVCMYDVAEKVMLRRFQISVNVSLDGVLDFLSSKRMTDAGPVDLINDTDDEDDTLAIVQADPGQGLPGAGARTKRAAVRTKCLRISPTGQAWAAATTEGVLIYSLDQGLVFDPSDLDMDVTPQAVENALQSRAWLKALLLSLRLNEPEWVRRCVESVPPEQVGPVVRGVPPHYLQTLIGALAAYVGTSPHTEFLLKWCQDVCVYHGRVLQQRSRSLLPAFRSLLKGLSTLHEDLGKSAADNEYTLAYLTSVKKARTDDRT